MSDAITIQESARLVSLEKTIERGLGNFIEVGEALAEIRDSRLYRIEHKTFEDYCRTKWKFSRMQASRLIGAADVCNQLVTKPGAESQARPLTRLDSPEQRREAWADAVEQSATGKPTAREVEAAVERVRPIPATKFSKDQEDAIAAAEKDPETLWLLKSYWKKATKKERRAFLLWAEDNN